ncbi:hypothetical protein GUJ93_ZPchr0006g46067 [Zizania palustris]|uniref:Uncharacterized protein n=1 Tax=Zizania palustris TaxID=103762 RepID=A0A8J5T0S0_ZIZPA|nr:hypothetical protein GUJ93_ZPchr0006g46067 [Zizania palustris]
MKNKKMCMARPCHSRAQGGAGPGQCRVERPRWRQVERGPGSAARAEQGPSGDVGAAPGGAGGTGPGQREAAWPGQSGARAERPGRRRAEQ